MLHTHTPYTAPHHITLHYPTLHYTTLHYTTPRYQVSRTRHVALALHVEVGRLNGTLVVNQVHVRPLHANAPLRVCMCACVCEYNVGTLSFTSLHTYTQRFRLLTHSQTHTTALPLSHTHTHHSTPPLSFSPHGAP
jgi:hypothetical protein